MLALNLRALAAFGDNIAALIINHQLIVLVEPFRVPSDNTDIGLEAFALIQTVERATIVSPSYTVWWWVN